MKLAVFQQIVEQLKSRDDIPVIAQEFSIPYDTLVSIYGTKYQKMIKQQTRLHHLPENVAKYVQAWREGTCILEMAEAVNFSPCLLARIIVASLHSLTKAEVSRIIKQPESLEDPRLRGEVMEAIEADDNFSPAIDRIRQNVGREYEYILQEKLNASNIPYITEEQLRREGYAKTPDVKLEIPMEVAGRSVNWIDSKAAFGDSYYHNTKNQHLKSYVNRFGPGMVIYWFGFVETLNDDPNVLVMEDFPRQVDSLFPRDEAN
eukprot:TRINITY_DN6170_c0_g1_i1.p1 TRINITY_DN6170_c0_g1~~TRINITY_DN6170_c0_g1_i1.p1  ORF type:complete len:261 (+),score=80.99 TRINITY_DN6170_c0_g1_i1:24-806(+)